MNIVRATGWSAVDIVSARMIQFGVSVVLARLLLPAEFGLMAMLVVFQGLATLFIDSGFSASLIQKRDVTHEQESAVFWFNLMVAVVAALILGLSGPAIAAFFSQPVLSVLVWPIALALLIGAAKNVHIALLARQLDFRRLSLVNIVSALTSGAIAIALALANYGVWALAWFAVASAVTSAGGLWLVHPWRPSRRFRIADLRPLFRFGSYMMLSGLMEQIHRQLSSLLIGRYYTPTALGHYARADTTRQIPSSMVGGIINRVAFPHLASMQGDAGRLRQALRRALQAMMVVNVPAMLAIGVAARPLILAVFGDQWLPAVPLLQILSLAGLVWPIHLINLNALQSQGFSRESFHLQVIKTTIGLVVMLAAVSVSVAALAWAQVILAGSAVVLSTWYSRKYLGYGLTRQILALREIVTAAAIMAGMVWLMTLWTEALSSRIVELVILGTVGSAVYVGLGKLLRIPMLSAVLSGTLRSELAGAAGKDADSSRANATDGM